MPTTRVDQYFDVDGAFAGWVRGSHRGDVTTGTSIRCLWKFEDIGAIAYLMDRGMKFVTILEALSGLAKRIRFDSRVGCRQIFLDVSVTPPSS